MAYKIAINPGDGIGTEVVPEGIRTLEALAANMIPLFLLRRFHTPANTILSTAP